ncbi:hypothetical protein THAOC_23683, partial [Thalassiosira oceanica]
VEYEAYEASTTRVEAREEGPGFGAEVHGQWPAELGDSEQRDSPSSPAEPDKQPSHLEGVGSRGRRRGAKSRRSSVTTSRPNPRSSHLRTSVHLHPAAPFHATSDSHHLHGVGVLRDELERHHQVEELHGLPPRQVLRRGLPEGPPQAAQEGMQAARSRAEGTEGREAVQSRAREAGGGLLPDLHAADTVTDA